MPSYQLYYAPGAASLAVHWMLLELGVEHELSRVDVAAREHKSERYLKLNPNGLLPTIVIDSEPMYECAAILLLLAERHPERKLAPPPATPARATYLMWMMHLTNTVQPAFRTWFFPQEAAGPQHEEAAKALTRERIERAWDRVDAELAKRPYMVGNELTAVDFLSTMLMRWSRNMPKPATEWPSIAAYVRRMKERPSFQALYAAEGLTEWA